MHIELLKQLLPTSPAFLLDKAQVLHNLETLTYLKQQSGCKILYAIKALPLFSLMQWLRPEIDGFSVSSLNEALLAHEVLGNGGHIHLTSPGIREDEMSALLRLCSHISFNSLNQWQRLAENSTSTSCGLRINPKLSFAPDIRFDPCRLHSKLGVDLNLISADNLPNKVQGLHFHTVFSSTDYEPLLQTLTALEKQLGQHFNQLKWLNLGGGYLFPQIEDHQTFINLVKAIKSKYDLDVFIEPGKALVGDAGYLITTVIDCFDSDGKQVAVLDSAINHHPEIFEYQRQAELLEHEQAGEYRIILVGSTCLAGDIFGEYGFTSPLKFGDRLVFNNVGAYTLIKANRFNGLPLPDIYALIDHQLQPLRNDSYQAYRQQWHI